MFLNRELLDAKYFSVPKIASPEARHIFKLKTYREIDKLDFEYLVINTASLLVSLCGLCLFPKLSRLSYVLS